MELAGGVLWLPQGGTSARRVPESAFRDLGCSRRWRFQSSSSASPKGSWGDRGRMRSGPSTRATTSFRPNTCWAATTQLNQRSTSACTQRIEVDPLGALRAACQLRTDLGAREATAARIAHRAGHSWAEVGEALEISRQAAHTSASLLRRLHPTPRHGRSISPAPAASPRPGTSQGVVLRVLCY